MLFRHAFCIYTHWITLFGMVLIIKSNRQLHVAYVFNLHVFLRIVVYKVHRSNIKLL